MIYNMWGLLGLIVMLVIVIIVLFSARSEKISAEKPSAAAVISAPNDNSNVAEMLVRRSQNRTRDRSEAQTDGKKTESSQSQEDPNNYEVLAREAFGEETF